MPRLIWVFAGDTGHFVGFVMFQPKCVSSMSMQSEIYWICLWVPILVISTLILTIKGLHGYVWWSYISFLMSVQCYLYIFWSFGLQKERQTVKILIWSGLPCLWDLSVPKLRIFTVYMKYYTGHVYNWEAGGAMYRSQKCSAGERKLPAISEETGNRTQVSIMERFFGRVVRVLDSGVEGCRSETRFCQHL